MQQKIISLSLIYLILEVNSLNAELLCRNPQTYVVRDKAQSSTYKECKRNGMTYWYNDNGDIKSKVNFSNDKENGLYTSYYANGQEKLVVHYKNGQKVGIQKIYYDNGQLGSQVNYVNGKREGVLTEWDFTGYKSSEVFYKNNYKVGVKKYFDKNGQVIKTEHYKMDRNPVIQKILEDKRKEIFVDLAKYGLMPKEAPKEERIR
ncbi:MULTISPECIES: toxin-antitoxin system YwqK family antitoxin [Sulfurimonas]|uniref:toxin-antitoxin system YwqK family antitoxin n=1 Tax=Sulfurimonas TaxID=202746 RepID=UPI00126514F7|nr:toxin-antitoxin system YwqK family antitoxin [Sulfurimonas indica]